MNLNSCSSYIKKALLLLTSPQISGDTQPKQARSMARQRALIEHGKQLFNGKGVDDVSIQEITQAVGFSTGSFYSYFTDKTAYFIAVQAAVATEQDALAEQIFEPHKVALLSVAERLHLCVAFAIGYFRQHKGLVHAALSYERRIPEGWQPNRKTTARIIARASADLPAEDKRQLEVSIQLAFGLLVNALLHDPGPLRLEDADLAEKIMGALTPYLEQDQPTNR